MEAALEQAKKTTPSKLRNMEMKPGCFDEFFYTIILDNSMRLIEQENLKRVLEKLCIAQMMTPIRFQIVMINNQLNN